MSDSLQSPGLWSSRLHSPWDSPGKISGVCCHFLLQGIFQTRGWNPLTCLLHWQADTLQLAPPGKPSFMIVFFQLLSCVWLFATPWIAARQASLSITNFQSLLKLISIESVIAIQRSHPLLSPYLPAFNLSQHQGLFQ